MFLRLGSGTEWSSFFSAVWPFTAERSSEFQGLALQMKVFLQVKQPPIRGFRPGHKGDIVKVNKPVLYPPVQL